MFMCVRVDNVSTNINISKFSSSTPPPFEKSLDPRLHTNEDVFDRLIKSRVELYFVEINYQTKIKHQLLVQIKIDYLIY